MRPRYERYAGLLLAVATVLTGCGGKTESAGSAKAAYELSFPTQSNSVSRVLVDMTTDEAGTTLWWRERDLIHRGQLTGDGDARQVTDVRRVLPAEIANSWHGTSFRSEGIIHAFSNGFWFRQRLLSADNGATWRTIPAADKAAIPWWLDRSRCVPLGEAVISVFDTTNGLSATVYAGDDGGWTAPHLLEVGPATGTDTVPGRQLNRDDWDVARIGNTLVAGWIHRSTTRSGSGLTSSLQFHSARFDLATQAWSPSVVHGQIPLTGNFDLNVTKDGLHLLLDGQSLVHRYCPTGQTNFTSTVLTANFGGATHQLQAPTWSGSIQSVVSGNRYVVAWLDWRRAVRKSWTSLVPLPAMRAWPYTAHTDVYYAVFENGKLTVKPTRLTGSGLHCFGLQMLATDDGVVIHWQQQRMAGKEIDARAPVVLRVAEISLMRE